MLKHDSSDGINLYKLSSYIGKGLITFHSTTRYCRHGIQAQNL